MPNHVHLILVPAEAPALRLALGETHQRYTGLVNRRQGWVGHLWQGRFASCALDGPHLVAAVRYVELNPVRACLVDRAEAWPWSSARGHLAGQDDGLATVAPLLDAVGDWAAFLAVAPRMAERRSCAGMNVPDGRSATGALSQRSNWTSAAACALAAPVRDAALPRSGSLIAPPLSTAFCLLLSSPYRGHGSLRGRRMPPQHLVRSTGAAMSTTGSRATHAAQRPPSQLACTLAPVGNSHPRRRLAWVDFVRTWSGRGCLLRPAERLAGPPDAVQDYGQLPGQRDPRFADA